MERHAIVMNMIPGMQQEYKRRHDELWPEMNQLLKAAGFKNYSIWCVDNLLFQYFEIENYELALANIKGNQIKIQWDEYMKDIIDEENARPMEQMFYFSGE